MTQTAPRRVLFVDDEPAMTQLGKVVLERAGHRCSLATNGEEGLQRILTDRPDLVILDYMMPGMSGAEVFRTLRTNSTFKDVRETPVLMLTAKTDNDTERRQLMELGLAAYLTKPFGHRELLNVIDNILITSEVRRQQLQTAGDIKSIYIGAIHTLLKLLETKDPYAHEHSQMAELVSVAVAEQYGLNEYQIETIRMAALLHDIGKVEIPEHILNKPEPFSADERSVMQQHVTHSVQILDAIPEMREVAILVGCHHERIDGKGYPQGLDADEIPLGARIIAVADAYDAMQGNRSYRTRLSKEETIAQLRAHAGTQFDGDVVEYFIEALETIEARKSDKVTSDR